jgi:Integrase core domain
VRSGERFFSWASAPSTLARRSARENVRVPAASGRQQQEDSSRSRSLEWPGLGAAAASDDLARALCRQWAGGLIWCSSGPTLASGHGAVSAHSGPFDELFRSEAIRIVKTPVRAPKANAIAQRFVRTVRAECLDWLLILNRRHLKLVLRAYVGHYNRERPHRALQLRPPEPDERPEKSPEVEIRRRDRLGGLIHEYCRAAA